MPRGSVAGVGAMAGAMVTVALVLGTGVAMGRGKPACDGLGKMRAPEDAEGQVVRMEPAQSRFSVRESDGVVHEFQASAETLRDLKVGDRIEVKLWEMSRCR
jgi:hypothetical protein